MPQATDELRDLMRRWFGDIDELGPARVLLSRGWTENRYGVWSPPVLHHTAGEIEWACLRFLRDEWDYDWEDPLYPEYG